MELRLLGALDAMAPGRLVAQARPVAIGAFLGLAATGSLLFAAEASHIVVNPAFRLKAVLVAAGLLNVAIYEFAGHRAIASLPPGARMPRSAKLVGVVSLGIWIAVAACGRSIAYF